MPSGVIARSLRRGNLLQSDCHGRWRSLAMTIVGSLLVPERGIRSEEILPLFNKNVSTSLDMTLYVITQQHYYRLRLLQIKPARFAALHVEMQRLRFS